MDTRIYEPTSGGKTTVFYFEIADGMDINYGFSLDIDPESDPVIYSDEELTKPVEKEEFMDAYRSGVVVVSCFTSSVALGDVQRYFVVGGITEGKDEGVENYVRVFVSPLDIEQQGGSTVIVYTSGTADESGNVEGFAYKNAEMTEAFTSPELKNAFIDGCIINVRLAEPDMFFGLLRPNLYQESEEGSYSTPSVIYGSHGTSTITITAIDPEVS